MDELRAAIHKAHAYATGPDHIHYQMLKNLPESALDTLLPVFNDSWITGNFPSAWSEATGKDPTDPGNYGPIALTSCLCKTFERLVNDGFVWFFREKQNFNGISKRFSQEP
jgi:hypothetical protein